MLEGLVLFEKVVLPLVQVFQKQEGADTFAQRVLITDHAASLGPVAVELGPSIHQKWAKIKFCARLARLRGGSEVLLVKRCHLCAERVYVSVIGEDIVRLFQPARAGKLCRHDAPYRVFR